MSMSATQDTPASFCQSLAVFQQPKFLRRVERDLAVRTDAERTAVLQETRRVENTVAQVGFGRRAQPGHGAGPGQRHRLAGCHMGGVDQAPDAAGCGGAVTVYRRAVPRG